MKAMAAVDKRGIRQESVARESCERDRRRLRNQGGLSCQAGGRQGVPANVVIGRLLKRIDDDVRHVRPTDGAECLADRQSGASIRESDLNDNVSVVSNEYVTQHVAVGGRECDALEI